MKVSTAKVKAAAVSGKIASAFGYFFGILFFLLFIAYMADDDADMGTFFFVALSLPIFLIVIGARKKRLLARFKKYAAYIFGQQIHSLAEISASAAKPLEFVIKDVQKMISKGYFADMEIDLAANTVITGGKTAQAIAAAQSEMEKYEKYSCPNCGAPGVKLKGEFKACEYCGRTI